MVIAAGRAYADLIRWIKEARPKTLDSWRLARRLWGTLLLGALVLLGGIGLLSPARFGSPTSRPRRGAEWWALAALVTVSLAVLLMRRGSVRSSARRLGETFTRGLESHPSFEPAVNALDSCPAALRTRFALGWMWGPAAVAVLAAVCAASAVYFVIDAILARFSVGPEQILFTGVNAVVSLLVLRLGAKRLAVWRLSLAVYRAVTRL
jgi:hypothetical protein